MKKTKLIVGLLVVAGCITAIAASKKNPVLMTVNGKAVTLSEFEYMYHKRHFQFHSYSTISVESSIIISDSEKSLIIIPWYET